MVSNILIDWSQKIGLKASLCKIWEVLCQREGELFLQHLGNPTNTITPSFTIYIIEPPESDVLLIGPLDMFDALSYL